MTQEEKQLLLKDLSARLPYKVKVRVKNNEREREWYGVSGYDTTVTTDSISKLVDSNFKPYLRPMSSMTEEEVKKLIKVQILSKHGKKGSYFGSDNIESIENIHFQSRAKEWFCNVTFNTIDGDYTTCFAINRVTWKTTIDEIDWLNAHHFDYRGLIEKGLALEASEGMYK